MPDGRYNSETDIVIQAIDDSQVAMVIVDVRAKDMPIVYANKAMEDLTGYKADEILGRNCRFLQGEDREQPGLKVVREALRRGVSCRVVLRNYKKDGTLFHNDLRLSPLKYRSETVTHFVGCQGELNYPRPLSLRNEALSKMGDLTPRECEMFMQLIEGQSTKSAARTLGISPRTAEKHRQKLLHKLDVSNTVELMYLAMGSFREDRLRA